MQVDHRQDGVFFGGNYVLCISLLDAQPKLDLHLLHREQK